MNPKLSRDLQIFTLEVRNCEDSPYFKTLLSLRLIVAKLQEAFPELKCEVDACPKMCAVTLVRRSNDTRTHYLLKFEAFESFPMTFELLGQHYKCEDFPGFEATVLEALRHPASVKLLRTLIYT